jgi:MerR family transcriptional regulator, heat shock protein HspR
MAGQRQVKYHVGHRSKVREDTVDGLDRRALYGISVTSELTGVNPQNLRVYESRGLIEPQRTSGGTRRYSEHDVARINRISGLLEAGLNLKGIAHVLELEAETQRLRREVKRLRDLQARLPEAGRSKGSGERGK